MECSTKWTEQVGIMQLENPYMKNSHLCLNNGPGRAMAELHLCSWFANKPIGSQKTPDKYNT